MGGKVILVEFPLSCLADLLKFSFLDKLWRREVKENERFRLAKSLNGTLL